MSYADDEKAPSILDKVDKSKAKDFTKGFQQPQTVSDGWQNIKSEVGSLFGDSDQSSKTDSGDKIKAIQRRMQVPAGQ